jgi:hypothetical protein
MSEVTGVSVPESGLERLIAGRSESGLLVFVFVVGWRAAHLPGAAKPDVARDDR